MEILNETIHYSEFLFFLFLIGGTALLFVVLAVGFSCVIINERDFSLSSFGVVSIVIVIAIGAITGTVVTIKRGANITYEAKVTDWNEVYDHNYEVVKQKGDIVTIKLKD